ncbi:glycoside hydrolase family 4 [Cerasicoccus arenae]|uniref:Alpha-glucosidase/alpha-galactosidase n=1 Tax=Cerasicoccus arenae TaxID=424488 RepID=A0A8J3DG52_9BACT|nr:glycoside hydrolase family 4 [Cerasicoccus arenae]MBK1859561.1 hypothetical protein [Cerasicoccus arenae]GHC03107.1 alpha-glucosidase/alpha-galactosidase [Cerasicoccus arenae]
MSNLKPTIVIIGAGSLFFGQKAIWSMNHLGGLKGGHLVLVDTDPDNLDRMVRLAKLAAETSGSGSTVTGTADYREALPGADYVVLSFSDRNAHFRKIDCEISAKYGIRMCSGDTIGPGGVFRAMREFPAILEIAHAVEELCPNAWLINYINPSAVMGIGLMRHSKAKSFALCDTHHLPHKKLGYMEMIGIDKSKEADFDMRIAGVNHFTWMLSATYQDRDVLPDIHSAFHTLAKDEKDEGYAKSRFNNYITAHLADVFGAVPTCTGHTKEYVPYYQGRSAIQEAIPPLSVFDCDERAEKTAEMWSTIDAYLAGEKPMTEFHEKLGADHATDIINTMVVEDGRNYFINLPNFNRDTNVRPVGNLPDDAFLELECTLDSNGPRPLPVGEFPMGLRAQQMLILDVHELTIEAIMKRDKNLLVRALAMDPLVNSIATAKVVIDELFIAQAELFGDWDNSEESTPTPELAAASAGPQLY